MDTDAVKPPPRQRFQFSLATMLRATTTCAVVFAVAVVSNDYLILPFLVGAILLIVFRTRGRVWMGLAVGAAVGSIYMLPDALDRAASDNAFMNSLAWVGPIYVGAIGAVVVGSLQATSLGHRVLGWSILMILIFAVVLFRAFIPQVD